MTAFEARARMQLNKGLVWTALLLGAMVFGFYMASNAPLLVLGMAGVGWMGSLPYHARLSAILGLTTYGSALMVPLMPGRPFMWELAAIFGWSGSVVLLILRRYAPDFGENVRRYQWILLSTLLYVVVLFYLMRTHGFGFRVMGGDRMGGRVYLQQIACASFPLVFMMVRFGEAEFVKLFIVHLGLSLTFVISDLALAAGAKFMWVFYVLDVANDSINFEIAAQSAGIRRFQSFAFVSTAALQWVLVLVPLRKLFSASAIWLIPLLLAILGIGLPGGHRGVLILLTGVFFFSMWAQRVWTSTRLTLFGGMAALVLAGAYGFGSDLPLPAQRTLTLLPGINLDPMAVADAQSTYYGRLTMRSVGVSLMPHYFLRGRGFGPATEPVPFEAYDPYGVIAEHVNRGTFYSGPVGMMVNTGLPGTLCLLGLVGAVTVTAARSLRYIRKHGAEDRFLRVVCVNASLWMVNVLVFLFVHGDAEFAMNTFGLHAGLVMACDWALRIRERKAQAAAQAMAALNPVVVPPPAPRRRMSDMIARPSVT